MGRFRYSLQSILDIKMKMETQAKQDFSAAKNALDDEESKLAALRRRKREYESEAMKLRSGKLNVRDITDNRAAILKMDEEIAQQKEKVAAAARTLEKAREHLTDVMKERKTQETLREKAFEEYKIDENKRESKEVDELTSYTYGQKRQVNR